MLEKIAVIVPCFNEEKRLKQKTFLSFARNNLDIDLWFVNDGSTDNTILLLEQMRESCPENIFILSMEKNGGKAEAVRKGILNLQSNRYKYTGFIDADLSAPLEEIKHLYGSMLGNSEILLTSGCRVKIVGKTIERSAFRHYISRIFVTYYSALLQLPNYDTQCGLKLFELNFALQLFEKQFVSRWMFDVELFLRALIFLGTHKYPKKVHEVPLNEWKEVGGSKLKLKDFLKAPIEIIKIRNAYKEDIHNLRKTNLN